MPQPLFSNIPQASSVNYQIKNIHYSSDQESIKVLKPRQFHILVPVKKIWTASFDYFEERDVGVFIPL